MSHSQMKFENPVRLSELNPKETLERIGLGQQDVICDIGAGSGIFTIPAAKMTSNSVFALDINDEFLNIIEEKMKSENLSNIRTIKVSSDFFDIQSNTVDFAILVTVLHEIDNKDTFLSEIKRMIKNTGKLAIIEFHNRQTPMGPPVTHRISKEEVITMCNKYGFSPLNEFSLGENYYCVVFISNI